jgi:hypothetical protein
VRLLLPSFINLERIKSARFLQAEETGEAEAGEEVGLDEGGDVVVGSKESGEDTTETSKDTSPTQIENPAQDRTKSMIPHQPERRR